MKKETPGIAVLFPEVDAQFTRYAELTQLASLADLARATEPSWTLGTVSIAFGRNPVGLVIRSDGDR